MTFWQENYGFIKDVYDMRHQKMMEWMENVERVSLKMKKLPALMWNIVQAIGRIMADKVYTSAEFKRERDNFHVRTKYKDMTDNDMWLWRLTSVGLIMCYLFVSSLN